MKIGKVLITLLVLFAAIGMIVNGLNLNNSLPEKKVQTDRLRQKKNTAITEQLPTIVESERKKEEPKEEPEEVLIPKVDKESGGNEPQVTPPEKAATEPQPEETPSLVTPVKTYYGNLQPAVEMDVLVYINNLRQELGLGLLQYCDDLTDVSRVRAGELAKNNYLDHIRPNGDAWHTVFFERNVYPREGFENIARSNGSYIDAKTLFNAWVASPSHYRTMTNPNMTHIGIGVVYVGTSAGDSTYSCTTFARY